MRFIVRDSCASAYISAMAKNTKKPSTAKRRRDQSSMNPSLREI